MALHRYFLCLVVAGVATLSACSTPSQNQVRTGSDPFHEDDSVAFRTTYYFRVFDYCVVKRTADGRRVLVPQIDSLYRFRMTGKGSTLLQNVKFESGTLQAHEIDPFGARIVRDSNTHQLRFRSQQETKEYFKQEADLAEFTRLLKLYESLHNNNVETPGSIPQSTLELLRTTMERSLQDYSGTTSAANVDQAPSYAVADLNASTNNTSGNNQITFNLEMLRPYRGTYRVTLVSDKDGNLVSSNIDEGTSPVGRQATLPRLTLIPVPTITMDSPSPPSFIVHFQDEYEAATRLHIYSKPSSNIEIPSNDTAITVSVGVTDMLDAGTYAQSGTQNASELMARTRAREIQCPEDAPTRRGFQILGPEGWRTFNQDDRLLLAMTTDAQPLISTLKNISSRMLNSRSSPNAVLLPVSEARRKLADAQLILDRAVLRDDVELHTVAEEISDALHSE